MFNKLKSFIFGKSQLGEDFTATLSTKIRVGDRVRHRVTRLLGTVFQTGSYGTQFLVPALSVRYDSGMDAILVPAEEFTKATKY